MSVFDLGNRIMKKINETTTSSAIAYLPGGFRPVRKALKTLAKKKKNWGIRVLENQLKQIYVVMFEGDLSIAVPKKYWSKFQNEMLGPITMDEGFMVSLGQYLMEDKEDQLKVLSMELKEALLKIRVTDPIKALDTNMTQWNLRFKGMSRTGGNVLLKYNSFEKDVEELHKKLLVVYSDDRGSLEMIIGAIEDKRPLNVFEVFDRYEYLYGGVSEVVYEGVDLKYQGLATMSWMTEEVMVIDDDDVIDEIGVYPGVKAVGVRLYPKSKMFAPKIFSSLKDEIDVLADKADKKAEKEVEK